VEVDIDLHAVPFRHAEHHVEVRVGITVERRRVQSADYACPFPNGRIE
jgi:hypothetical protein